MRMTRAQAAAQAAAVADESPDQSDGLMQERPPLGELAANSEADNQTNAKEEVNGKYSSKHEEAQATVAESDSTSSPTPVAKKTKAKAPLLENNNSNNDIETQPDISIHQDARQDLDAESPTVEVPQLNLTPQRTPAKKLMAKDPSHMRSTSNKENIFPNSPVPHRPIQRQDPLPESHLEHHTVQQTKEEQTAEAPAQQAEQDVKAQLDVNPEHQLLDEPEQEADNQVEHQPELGSEDQTHAGHDDLTPVQTEVQQESRVDQQSDIDTDVRPDHQPVDEPEPQVELTPVQDSLQGPAQEAAQEVPQEPVQEPVPEKLTQPEAVPAENTTEIVTPSKVPAKSVEKKQSASSTATQVNGKAKAAVATSVKNAPVPGATPRPETKKPASRPSARPSSIIRSSSVRKSVVSKPEPAANAALLKRATSVKKPAARPSTAAREPLDGDEDHRAEKGPANIPHSKRRPMSMSFPTPPPPPKSSKPPTKSNFQLPGEAIAAKLKAAKEARMKKEEEEKQTKPPAFKARPVPSFKESGAIVRQTATSRARLQGKDAPEAGSSNTGGGLKRASTVRESMLKGERPTSTANKRLSTVSKPGPGVAIPAPRTSAITSHKRTMSTPSTAPKARTVSNSTSTSTAPQRVTSNGTKKGKEVFGRAVAEKETLEKQRREKEEAAKKARADAAERGRIASREWAAKMKLKKDNKGKENAVGGTPTA